jgi:ATP phosphoribosyltransferase
VPGNSAVERLEDLDGKKIATELVNYTRKFFAEKKINVDIEFSWGATEAKVVSGLADAIVEVTETESTIRAHGLKIIYEMMTSNTQFIANKKAWEDPWKREKIENIVLLLKGALRADKLVGLKMNAPASRLDEIISLLPSLNAPTIANLYNTDWYSVETVISEKQVRELIPRLMKHGAEGIIEYGLNKVI